MTVAETKWTLPTPDGKTIYGVKNSPLGQGATAAIFIAHGLNCSMYDYHIKRAADVFATSGYDVYRFNFYDGRDNGRTLVDCTLLTHAADLTTVIEAFGNNYTHIFAAGHSFGGATVMLANPKGLAAASLWDPSYNIAQINKDFESAQNEFHGYIRQDWGTSILLGLPMYHHENSLDEAACIQLAKNFNAPVQVVFAADGYYVNQPLNYHSHGNPLNTSVVVQGTSHCFYEGDSCEDLIAQTQKWFSHFQ